MPWFFKRLFLVWVTSLLLLPSLLVYSKPVFATSSISFTELGNIIDPGAGASGSYFGIDGMVTGDINGDGYQDLFIPANRYSSQAGRLYVYYGGSTLDTTADITIDQESGGNNFPEFDSIIGVADLNNDGFVDILAGAFKYNSNAGRAYVFFGSSNPSSSLTADAADIIIDGNSTTLKALGVASAIGDFNGDGNQDLAISAPYANSNAGTIEIFYGNGTTSFSATSDVTLAVSSSSYLGIYEFQRGDFNGDGFDDLLAGEIASRSNVYIFYGGSNMSTTYGVKFSAETTSDWFPRNGAGVGDINHDGYDDTCMGAAKNSTAATKAGRVYCFFGSSALSGDKLVANADLIYTGAANDDFGRGADLYDVNNDGNLDLIVGAYQTDGSDNGYVNIYFGTGTTLNTTADLTITAADLGESEELFGTHVLGGDIKNSGWPQLFLTSANGGGSNTGKVHVLEPNHGTPSINSAGVSGAGTTTPTVTGTASDSNSSYTISDVQWSTQSTTYGSSGDNIWTSCTASDGSFNSSSEGFSCNLGTQTNGSKTVYLRTVDQNSLYMSPKLYGNVGFTVDTDNSQGDWITSNGETISFNNYSPQNNSYTDNTLPTFKFIKAADGRTRITKYQIILTNNLPSTDPNYFNNRIYLDDIDPYSPNKAVTVDQYGKANKGSQNDRTRQETNKDIYYEDYSMAVTPKNPTSTNQTSTNTLTLAPAAYKWKVRAVDENGSTIDTEEKLLLVKTHNGSFTGGSNSSLSTLPLSLTYLGSSSSPLNISNLNPTQILPSYSIYTLTPTFTGITYSNYNVNLTLTDTQTNKTILTKQVTSQNSRFNINVKSTDKLTTGEYTLKLTASNIDNYVQLPTFKLNVKQGSSTSTNTNTGTTNISTDTNTEADTFQPIIPTPNPTPTPNPITSTKPQPFSIITFFKSLLRL